jgi:acetyl-CoA carboxylase biotin carboxyl carrier protein
VTDSSASDNQKDAAATPAFLDGEQLDLLSGLAQIVERENLSELELEDGTVRMTLRRAAEFVSFAGDADSLLPGQSTAGTPLIRTGEPDNLVAIEAPMVGVFYHAPAPNEPAFVEVGSRVEAGQTIGVIEAMKVFNEINSEVEGTVVQIVAGNAELVEAGSTLIRIKQG